MSEHIISHKTVLLEESIQALDIKPGGVYVDATLGGGGHTKELLSRFPDITVIGLDWDKSVIETTGQALQAEFPERFFCTWGNFARIDQLIKKVGFTKVDGILADFGTSQIQIGTTPGLSIFKDSFLDMRMSTSHFKTTACDILKEASEKELSHIFWEFGEEPAARKIARAIVQHRAKGPIVTTHQLAKIVETVIPYHKGKRIHPATKVFQALRIVVNKELENIRSFLHNAVHVLNADGRIACISFHSLEDRSVKQFFKEQSMPGGCLEIITQKVLVAGQEELSKNRSSRSAKLRVAKKKELC
jgi:16S rRNA (cytosine1402-N4)-methyltransferase